MNTFTPPAHPPAHPFSSAYLEHLSLLAKETKDRMKGVPAFYIFVMLAFVTHVTILVPVYFITLSEEIPQTKQIHLTFAHGKTSQRPTLNSKESNVTDNVTDQIDNILDDTPQEKIRQNIARPQPKSSSTDKNSSSVSAAAPIPRRTSTPQRRNRDEPQTLRGNTNRYGTVSSVKQRPSGSGSTQGVVAARGVLRDNLSEETKNIVTKYEALLSGWIHSHQKKERYNIPIGTTARVVIRLRINRQGYVQFKVIERSSGYGDFDQVALETVQLASPVPAVPAEYPGGDQVEFLIPMSVTLD
ncbi:MAG: TonB family protein [Alphaproteobacteria bacterium]|nr:MAG: TonB family protein [Alphaproteobacteria bacterium]